MAHNKIMCPDYTKEAVEINRNLFRINYVRRVHFRIQELKFITLVNLLKQKLIPNQLLI